MGADQFGDSGQLLITALVQIWWLQPQKEIFLFIETQEHFSSSSLLLCCILIQSVVYLCIFCWLVLFKCAVCVSLLCSSSSRSLTSSAARRGQTETNAANFLVWWVQVHISLNLSLLQLTLLSVHRITMKQFKVIVGSNLLCPVHFHKSSVHWEVL